MLLEPVPTFIEQFAATAEAVDQQTANQGTLHGPEQSQGAHDLGEHTAAFDVGHQKATGPQVLGQTQVGEVARLKVHFHGTARSLEHEQPLGVLDLQGVQALADGGPAGPEPVAVIVLSAAGAHRTAQVDHLARAVALGFEQHRIHGAFGFPSCGPGLECLGVGHFPATWVHPGVVAHVLALEGEGGLSPPFQHPTQGCGHQRFPRSTAGAEHHERGVGSRLAHGCLAEGAAAKHRSASGNRATFTSAGGDAGTSASLDSGGRQQESLRASQPEHPGPEA